ncbi:MAG: NUDIX domain-containing protein, partial [Pseudomonadota bacterium]
MPAQVHVAVGVIVNGDGQILISRRDAGVHQGGLWEFPGGKREAGEDITAALARELEEELGIVPSRATPLLEVAHDYGDKQVLLDVYVVWEHTGSAHSREGQPLA